MKINESLIEIREATAADLGVLSVLSITTFYEAYFEQDEPADLANYIFDSFGQASLEAQLSDPANIFFLLNIDDHAVGYAKLVAGSTHPSVEAEKTIELKRIYIVERYWGRGVGEALLRHCERKAAALGNDSIWLGVWQKNERGQRFYAKQGFTKRGTIIFPYGENVGINDVMEKTLFDRPELEFVPQF